MSFPKPFYKWRPHPWHGLSAGEYAPKLVNAFIEITPFDSIKYELDKATGFIRVDRPQRTSSQPPALYGFIPQTFCGENVAKLSPTTEQGDGDPLDIVVISERPINRGEVILTAKVVGGIQMVDDKEADDKIIAVLHNDNVWGWCNDLEDIPKALVERIRHYFSTYKFIFGEEHKVSIESLYGAKHAYEVIRASQKDYENEYGV